MSNDERFYFRESFQVDSDDSDERRRHRSGAIHRDGEREQKYYVQQMRQLD